MYNKQTSMLGGHYDTTKFVEKVYNNKIFDLIEWFICHSIQFRYSVSDVYLY